MKKMKVSLVLNLLNIIFGTTTFTIRFTTYALKNLFYYYTRDSSFFLLVVTVILFIYEILHIYKNKELPKLVYSLKYIAVGLSTLTLLMCIFGLGPVLGETMGYKESYKFLFLHNECFFEHLLCPLIGFISFIFFENEYKMNIRDSIFALFPTILYGVIILILVGFKAIKPPYFFFDIYSQPVYSIVLWLLGLVGFIFLLYLLLAHINNRRTKKE